MSHRPTVTASLEAAPHLVQNGGAPLPGPSVSPRWGGGCLGFLSLFLFPSLRRLGRPWWLRRALAVCPQPGRLLFSPLHHLGFPHHWMDVDDSPFSKNKTALVSFPPVLSRGDARTAAVAWSLVFPQRGRIHPSPLASAAGDGSHRTKGPRHWPWERADLKAVVGDCLNLYPLFFICLRGFAVSVTPPRDPSSSVFGCEYLTSF